MTLTNDISIKKKVAALLLRYPELRDDDRRLVANFWRDEFDYKNSSAQDMLTLFAQGRLAHPESIRRIRQKLQELRPELRGERYGERQTFREVLEREGLVKLANGSVEYE